MDFILLAASIYQHEFRSLDKVNTAMNRYGKKMGKTYTHREKW